MIESAKLANDMASIQSTITTKEHMIKKAEVKNPQAQTESEDHQRELLRQKDELNAKQVAEVIEKVNEKLEVHDKKLQYSMHERTNQILIKVIDAKTDEVIKEVPDEKIVNMIADMREAAGLLVDEKL